MVFAASRADGWEIAIDKDGDAGVTSQAAESGNFDPPPIRLRLTRPTLPPAGGKHLLVVPYKYGTAIEYDGVLECWVQDFSVHSPGQRSTPQGARLWVGNHDDTGGLRITASNLPGQRHSELSSQLFTGVSGGDLRFVVRDVGDSFEFRSGAELGDRTRLRVTADGELLARVGEPQQVRVGAAGGSGQAGVAFGPKGDVRVYRESATRLRTNARFVAGGGLGVGGAVPARKLGRIVSKLEIFDTHGRSLGFLAIHAKR